MGLCSIVSAGFKETQTSTRIENRAQDGANINTGVGGVGEGSHPESNGTSVRLTR